MLERKIADHETAAEYWNWMKQALYKICFWTDFTGRNEESIKLHQTIIEENPFSELAWFNLAAAFQGLKLYEKAIDAYQYAVAIDEKFDYAYRNMGDAFLRLRKYKEAIEVLEKVLELSRPEDVIYEAIGHCYHKHLPVQTISQVFLPLQITVMLILVTRLLWPVDPKLGRHLSLR